jgi:demethylmenaquinone methyltransferase/2-methoxy-6-polyprenyl-1,4-benzoquinol methylase
MARGIPCDNLHQFVRFLSKRGDLSCSADLLAQRRAGSWSVDDPQAHGRAVRSMFSRISGVYDRMNHLLSLNRDRRWRSNVVCRLDDDQGRLLDLCAGTGDLALACDRAGKGRELIAADFCPAMLRASRGKPGAKRLQLLAADGLDLPLAAVSVDTVVVGFGVRNFADLRRGLAEITRVLRPGGQLAVLDFFRDDRTGQAERRGASPALRWLLSGAIPVIGRLVGGDGAAYSYLPGSVGVFLTPTEFVDLLVEFGYTGVYVDRQTYGIAHIVGGRRPHG